MFMGEIIVSLFLASLRRRFKYRFYAAPTGRFRLSSKNKDLMKAIVNTFSVFA